jgi:plastocyanin
MRNNLGLAVLAAICGAALSGCGGGTMPAAPSQLSATTPSGANGRLRPLDDPPAATLDPVTPDPVAPPPTPMAVIIQIVSSFGTGAFMPNPTMANVGDQIVFTNTDAVLHHIVLDDGTDLGDVAPGQSSTPVSLTTPTATFHCTIHPSMVGSINGTLPAPDPYYPSLPPDYGYY